MKMSRKDSRGEENVDKIRERERRMQVNKGRLKNEKENGKKNK
jgi:hypothetical protein